MPATTLSNGPQRTLNILGSLVLIVVCLNQAQQVLIPVALAVLLAFILTPMVAALERKRLGRIFSVLLTVVLAFSLLTGAGWAIVKQFADLAREVPDHTQTITSKIEDLSITSPAMEGLKKSWKDISKSLKKVTENGQADEDAPPPPMEVSIAPPGLAWFPKILGPFVEFLATFVLVIFLVIFMLIRREDLRNRFIRLAGRGQLTTTTRAVDEAAQRISRFLFMQLVINLGFGTLLGVGLSFLGVQYAFLWGGLAVALRFAPYVGTWIAAVLPLAYSVAVSPGWVQPGEVLGLFVVLELFTANVMEPLLFSHSTGVSPVALLVSIVFWTWLWGPIGLLLSTPLTTCLVVLGKYVPNMEFLDVLLGSEPGLETEEVYYQRLLARDQDEAAEVVEDFLRTKPLEGVYDDILLPGMIMARRDRERDELVAEDEQYIMQVTRDLLEDLVLPQQQFNLVASGPAPLKEGATPPPARALGFGYPAKGEADALALEMFRQLLEPKGCELEVASTKMLSSEMVAWVAERHPAFVCIAATPPAGIAHARYLCKRLRSQFPDLKIVVGRWGQKENQDKIRERFRQAGADFVGTSLVESRNQVIPLIQLGAHPVAETGKPVLQGVGKG